MNVKFYPKPSNVSVEVCPHRHDASMTFTEQSDARYASSVYACEMYGFKYNIRLGLFVSNLTDLPYTNNDDIGFCEDTGVIKHGIYSSTEMWVNNSNIEIIPDYYNTIWTEAGAALFPNITVGESKITRYPNHGQELYDVSNGAYGYDEVSQSFGLSNGVELYGVIDNQKEWFKNEVGRYPSTASFRNGREGCSVMAIHKYLAMRNSSTYGVPASSNTYYGQGYGHSDIHMEGAIDRVKTSNIRSSSRAWDGWQNNPEKRIPTLEWIEQQIAETCINRGWWRDFTHWQYMRRDNNFFWFDEFFEAVNRGAGNNFIHSCCFDEAIEYLFLREITKRVTVVEGSQYVDIVIDLVDKFKTENPNNIDNSLLLESINTPLSVKIDLTGTFLDGKNVGCTDRKIISKGDNIYVVEIPFTFSEGLISVRLIEKDDGYYNTGIPQVLSVLNSNNRLGITCDMKCKAVLYRVLSGGEFYDSLPIYRINTLKSNHVFEIEDGYDYRVGIISEFGFTSMYDV